MKKNNFTLLEVICAMVIIAIGSATLLTQLITATRRAADSREQYLNAHQIAQAAEYILLNPPETPFDPAIFSEGYSATFRWSQPEGVAPEIMLNGHSLQKVEIKLYNEEQEIDNLELLLWVKNDLK
ncbi:MAG: type II secretion system protein [Victivallaceae bacterium]